MTATETTRPRTIGQEPELAPGLLLVLQQAAGIRFGLFVAGLALFALIRPSGRNWITLGLMVAESAVLLAYVLAPWPRRQLGAWFLPLALAWSITLPFVERALSLTGGAATRIWVSGTRMTLDEGDISLIWLLVPVVLIGWQYGRRWFYVALAIVMGGYIWLGLLLGGDVYFLSGLALTSIGRLALIILVGIVVMEFAAAQQAEHRALEAANRQLAERAAMAEQLAESRERNRLARELHDTLAHSLTGLSVQLQALDTLLDHDPQAAKAQLAEAKATVRSGIQESRRAIQALRATPLEDLGLPEALRQLARRQVERSGMALTCDVADVGVLDPATEQTIYRVAAAALANVEEHSAATAVTLRLVKPVSGGKLTLEIRDNGLGFDPAAVPADRYGLASMAERAALIGATLTVESEPNAGTRVVLVTDR